MLRCSSFFLKTQTIVIQELTSKYGKLKKKNEKQLVNINFAECCCLTSFIDVQMGSYCNET